MEGWRAYNASPRPLPSFSPFPTPPLLAYINIYPKRGVGARITNNKQKVSRTMPALQYLDARTGKTMPAARHADARTKKTMLAFQHLGMLAPVLENPSRKQHRQKHVAVSPLISQQGGRPNSAT